MALHRRLNGSALGSHQSVLQTAKDASPGTTLTQFLLGESPTVNLPQMKRERLWSVMLNADKRDIETKGKSSSSALMHYLGTLRCAFSACNEYWKCQWFFFSWNWVKWSWICSNITAIPSLICQHDCSFKSSEEIPFTLMQFCSETLLFVCCG